VSDGPFAIAQCGLLHEMTSESFATQMLRGIDRQSTGKRAWRRGGFERPACLAIQRHRELRIAGCFGIEAILFESDRVQRSRFYFIYPAETYPQWG